MAKVWLEPWRAAVRTGLQKEGGNTVAGQGRAGGVGGWQRHVCRAKSQPPPGASPLRSSLKIEDLKTAGLRSGAAFGRSCERRGSGAADARAAASDRPWQVAPGTRTRGNCESGKHAVGLESRLSRDRSTEPLCTRHGSTRHGSTRHGTDPGSPWLQKRLWAAPCLTSAAPIQGLQRSKACSRTPGSRHVQVPIGSGVTVSQKRSRPLSTCHR